MVNIVFPPSKKGAEWRWESLSLSLSLSLSFSRSLFRSLSLSPPLYLAFFLFLSPSVCLYLHMTLLVCFFCFCWQTTPPPSKRRWIVGFNWIVMIWTCRRSLCCPQRNLCRWRRELLFWLLTKRDIESSYFGADKERFRAFVFLLLTNRVIIFAADNECRYGVATISRLLQIIGLFFKRAL